jgi:hypothetical protein
MVRLIVFFAACLLLLDVQAQVDKLRLSSDSIISCLFENNFEGYVEKIYPPVVEMAGGKEVYLKEAQATAQAWKNAGFTNQKMTFKNVLPAVKAGDEIHTIVTYETEYLMKDYIFAGNIYLLAISKDSGQHWSFLNLESYDRESIADFIPNYNFDLPFPIIEGPVLKESK